MVCNRESLYIYFYGETESVQQVEFKWCFPGYFPCCPDVVFLVITLWGGHPAPHAAAQEDAWRRILEFMECNLRG